MAIRTVAQAAADIRLTDAKANADFERIRRDLIAKATRLEADMAVSIPVTVDQNSLRNVATGLSRLQQAIPPVVIPTILDEDAIAVDFGAIAAEALPPLVVPVTADVDQALGEIAALTSLDAEVRVRVTADTDAALNDIIALSAIAAEVTVPVVADTDDLQANLSGLSGDTVLRLAVDVDPAQVRRELEVLADTDVAVSLPVVLETEGVAQQITGLGASQLLGVNVPVRANLSQVTSQIARVTSLAEGPFTVRFVADVDQVRADVSAVDAAADPVQIPILGDNEQAVAAVQAVGDAAQPVTVSVLADTEPVIEAIRRIEPPPLVVPLTAAQAGPGISTPALSRIRADLASLTNTPVIVAVDADTDQALADITALGGADTPPVIVPVDADTSQARADINALGGGPGGPPPVTVPVTVDGEQARAGIAGVAAGIDREITPRADDAGRNAGTAFARRFSTTANRIMATAAITIGGVFATSLVEGFQRFTTIEDSTESLTVALQSASEAGQVLADVLNVVRGTPFRLDDFARAATNMISFGIAAEKVPFFLTAIGEAAATRGSQANQFAQSLASIFGQIQAVGRINGEDVWQFGNVGVDVLRILGNTIGKTTEEIRKMISEGAIPAEFALDALANGILRGTDGINGATVAFSGVMERLGDTLSGSIENFGAARARFGVAIIDPLSDTLIAGFQSFTKVIDNFTARTRVAFDDLVETPLFDKINDFFEEAPSLIEPTAEALESLGPALAPLSIAFGALGLGALGSVLGPLGAIIPGVTGISGALVVAASATALLTPQIRDELLPTLQDLGEIGLDIGGTIVRGLGEGIEAVTPTVVRALGVVRGLGPEIRTVFTTALGSIAEVGPEVLPILDNLVTFAEQALPVALEAVASGVVLVSQAAQAAAPVINQLVLAGTDLIPVAATVLDAAQVLGSVLIPVLDTLGELIGDLPVEVLQTMLGVFLGFKAANFIGGIVSNMEGGFRKMGVEAGKTVRTMQTISSTAVAAGAAVSGAFSGMALASEDSSARITGAVGAIGSVFTGLALGGVPGGIFAAVGVGIGYIAQGFIDSRREAEALERAVIQLADRIRSEFTEDLVTPEGIINTRAFEEAVLQGVGTDALLTLKTQLGVGFDEIQEAARTEAELIQRAIELGMDPKGITFFEDFVDLQIGQLGRLRAEAEGKLFDFSESLARRIGGFDLAGLGDSEFIRVSEILAKEFSLDQEDVRAQMEATKDAQKELGEGFRDTVVVIGDSIAETLVAQDVLLDQTQTTWGDLIDVMRGTGAAAEETGDAQVDAATAAQDALADWKQALLDDGVTMEELREQARLLGEDVETSVDRASAAMDRFGEVLDSIKTKLDLRIQTQDLDKDFREIGQSLSEVINTEDLKKAEGVQDDIAAVEKRIAELKVRLAEETAQGDILRVDLQRRIARASALGFENTVAALQTELEETFFGARDIQLGIDEEFAKIAELRGELSELSAVPETLLQRLTAQAAEANLSFFEFLLAAPTPEAEAFFQEQIAGTITDGLGRAADIAELEGPIAGARAAEAFLAPFRASLISGGIPEGTVDQIIAEVWPADRVQLSSEQAAIAAAEAFFAEIERISAAEPGTIDLAAAVTDLDAQAAEIETFIAEHPEIKLPVGLDIAAIDTDLADLRARQFQEAVNVRIKQLEDAAAIEQIERFGGPALVAASFKTPREKAQEISDVILDEIAALNASDGTIVEIHAQFEDISSEVEDLQTIIDTQDIRIPISLDPTRLTEDLEEAQRAATQRAVQNQINAAIRNQLLPSVFGGAFFAQGGITGYADAPHTPQIAYGYRVWAEPETGGEAYIPLGMGKRVSALGVLTKVADIFDFDLHPRDKDEIRIVTPPVTVPPPMVSFSPIVRVPDRDRWDPKTPEVRIVMPPNEPPEVRVQVIPAMYAPRDGTYLDSRTYASYAHTDTSYAHTDAPAIMLARVGTERLDRLEREILDRQQVILDRQTVLDKTFDHVLLDQQLTDRRILDSRIIEHQAMIATHYLLDRQTLDVTLDRTFDRHVLDRSPVGVLDAPPITLPELASMFAAIDHQNVDTTAIRNAVVDALHAVRRPVTQEDLERNVIVERIESLVIGPGESARKRASEFVREMRMRAAKV